MYEIYFVKLNEVINGYKFSKLLSFVSVEKQNRNKAIKSVINKKLIIYSELLVRALACKSYNVKNDELNFTQNAYGKPQLAGFSQFHFNISHTRNAIVVAISEKVVGIDIERIKEANMNIAHRFFTEQEKAYIFNKTGKKNKRRRFYEIWTQKEAYIKYIGKGLSAPLKSFDVTESVIQDRIFCIAKEGYIISICGDEEINRDNIKIIQLAELSLLELAFSVLS